MENLSGFCTCTNLECPIHPIKSNGFSDAVVTALSYMTHDDNTPYMEYVKKLSENPIARKVKLADLRHNSDLSRLDFVYEEATKRCEKYKRAIQLLEAENK